VRVRESAEGSEGWRSIQASGKITDEGLHGGMPEAVEAEEIHLIQGLLARPLFVGDAIGSHEDAGAVFAKMAVNEYFLSRIVAEEREKLNHLFVGRRRPFVDGDVDEAHSQGLDLLAFPEDFCGIFEAKIDDGVDAEFFELGETFGFRLGATVEMIIHFSTVGNKGDAKFFSVGRMHLGGRSGRRSLLSAKKKRRERGKNENEEKPNAFHNGLDAKNCSRRWEEVKSVATKAVKQNRHHYK
jgi:hypothetical protein